MREWEYRHVFKVQACPETAHAWVAATEFWKGGMTWESFVCRVAVFLANLVIFHR